MGWIDGGAEGCIGRGRTGKVMLRVLSFSFMLLGVHSTPSFLESLFEGSPENLGRCDNGEFFHVVSRKRRFV